ncbi:hypothetical protein GCM10009850_084330 [Nonomuraea monospora]|uniref:NlpC/P60 domain-containing protein n=2 Tax=Nonomuraea monospora TaxID=568818 RepID=A0ABN3CU34_9ACTN
MFFDTDDAARRRLLALTRMGLLERFRPNLPPAMGTAPYHYVIGETAAAVLDSEDGIELSGFGYRRDRILSIVYSQRLAHTVGTNGIATSLYGFARRRSPHGGPNTAAPPNGPHGPPRRLRPLGRRPQQHRVLPRVRHRHRTPRPARAERLLTYLTGRPAKPKPSRKADDLRISAADAHAVRESLELATSLGVPRATIVADVQQALDAGALPSLRHEAKTTKNNRQLAEKIVTTVAQRVCDKLSQKISEVLDPETLAAIRTSGRGAVALAAALKMIGVPYSWGGGGPQGPSFGIAHGAGTKGFDCSGLAEYAWAKAGVKIGGHTSAQWRAGTRVPRSQLKPGDLLFFATNPNNSATIHHVVLNIDGKRYVHAPTTGSKVQIGHWTARREAEYAGAIRPRTSSAHDGTKG